MLTKKTLHPLVTTAAIAVIVVSVLGAITLINSQVSAHRDENAPAPLVSDAGTTQAPVASPAAIATAPAPVRASHAAVHSSAKATSTPAPSTSAPASLPPVAEAPAPTAAPPTEMAAAAPPAPPACSNCGVVSGVRAVKTAGEGTGLGAVAGGVVGGLLGHQFGKGTGKDVTSVLGVVGGAVAGHQVEKQARATTRYAVDVRLDNGQLQTVSVPADPGPIVGRRARIENSQLVLETAPS